MRRRYWYFRLAIAACLAFAFEARADDIAACNNANPEVKIFGCSAIIDAGAEPPETIAIAHFNRALAYHAKGELDLAIADYGKAIALNPKFAEAYANRGRVYEKQGRKQKAAADYRRAFALYPDDPVATEGLQRPGEVSAASETKRAAKSSFMHFANTDFAGALLEKNPAGSAEECEAQCQAHGDCAAFTFNVWNAACFLKSQVTAALLEPSSVSGLPASATPPPRSTAAKSMVRYRGRVFPGKSYGSATAASFETCEGRCEDDAKCLAFSFVKGSNSCRQFAKAGEYAKDKGIDSGVKRQVGQ
jgi:tetratricopeptide (TPR) repeat protein